MIRRSLAALLLLAAVAMVLSAANLPQQWRSWRYSRAVQDASAEGPAHSEITLPWDLVSRCGPACGDVRLIDDRGQEVPFALSIERGESQSQSHETKLIENSFVRGQYTQLIADSGEKPPLYDRVSLETGEANFIVWVELALSDDARTWRVVEPRAPIARFRSRAVDGTQTIPFQGLYSRYVRARIFQAAEQFPVSAVRVLYEVAHAAARTEIPAFFQPGTASDAGESSWAAGLNSTALPVSDLRFATDTREFYRAVRISGSDDGKEWSYVSSGTIYRYLQNGNLRESLRIEFPECTGRRFLRAEIVNGNDQPLANVRIAAFGTPRKLIFKQESSRAYRVLYGSERATPPQYDLKNYLESGPPKPVHRILALGPEEATANFLDPRPFTERHRELLWLALAVAVVLLGYTALRTLRTPPAPQQ